MHPKNIRDPALRTNIEKPDIWTPDIFHLIKFLGVKNSGVAQRDRSMDYKDFALDLAKKAGGVIRSNFSLDVKKEWKADNTPVTETDTSINKMVIAAVEESFPDHGVLGEEESRSVTNAEYLWVCDPVDGTMPFSHGIPTCVFSLALVKDGKPILGVVYDPFIDRLFYAEIGKGAFLNGKSIKVNTENLNGNGVIGWPSRLNVFQELPNVKILNLWCVVYEGMLVAAGELVAAYYPHLNSWDVAALKVIVEEAGGKVTDKHGNEQRYDGKVKGAVISNGLVHDQLVNLVKEKGI